MVTKVASISFCALLLCATVTLTPAIAGGPCYPQPTCAPTPCAPTYCGPPTPCGPPSPCGPPMGCGPRTPFSLCSGILGCCAGICGTVIKIPAAIMGGLLAPPIFGSRMGCRNQCAPQPQCAPYYLPAPCPAPQRIRKCKTNYSYQVTVPAPYQATMPAPYPPQYYPAAAPAGVGQPLPLPLGVPGPGSSLISEKPLKLVAGALMSPKMPDYQAFADKDAASAKSKYDCIW